MPLSADWLPLPTPHDPAEDPPGSLDPLGTLLHAERLADILLPGFTARMWRGRLLTVTTLTAYVADRAVSRMDNREEARLEARLCFERLLVSAIVRRAQRDHEYADAARNLPGRDLASTAIRAGEPLTRANFLKGQAVNGPFGVMARLARQLELVDVNGQPGRNAIRLLSAWAEDEELSGVLDEDGASPGAKWLSDAVTRTVACIGGDWPGPNSMFWDQLALNLRPDRIRRRERRFLLDTLRSTEMRARMIELLKQNVELFRSATNEGWRGEVERAVLLRGIKPCLNDEPLDRLIDATIAAVDAYEKTAGLLQQTFDSLIFMLRERGGRAPKQNLLADPRLRRHLEKTRAGVHRAVSVIDRAAGLLDQKPIDSQAIEALRQIGSDARDAAASVEQLVETVMRRHLRVQKAKRKACWIEVGSTWTLMPGEHRVDADGLPVWHDAFLHPFRIPNAYALLRDLGHVAASTPHAEVA